MAYRLMQQHARPTGPQNNLHIAGRSSHRIQLQDGLTRRLAGEMLWRLVAGEKVKLYPATAAGTSAGVLRTIPSDDIAVQTSKRLRIVGKGAVGGSNQNMPQLIVKAGAHLNNPGIIGARGTIRAHHQFELRSYAGIGIRGRNGVQASLGSVAKTGHLLFGRT